MSGRRALSVCVACGLLALSAARAPAQPRQAAVRPKVNHPGFAAMHFPPQAGLMQQQQLQYLMLQRNNPALTGLRSPVAAGLQTAAMTRPAGRCGPTAPTSNTALTTILANPKPFLKPTPSFVPKPFLTPVALPPVALQTPSGQPKPFLSPTPSVSQQPKPPCSHTWPVQTQPQFVTVIVQNSQPCGCVHPKPFGMPFNFTLLQPFNFQPPNLTMSFPVVNLSPNLPSALTRAPAPLLVPLAHGPRTLVNPLPRLPGTLLTPIAQLRIDVPTLVEPPVVLPPAVVPIVIARAEPPMAPLPKPAQELVAPLPKPGNDPAPRNPDEPPAANPLPRESSPLLTPVLAKTNRSTLLTPVTLTPQSRSYETGTPTSTDTATWPSVPPLPRSDLLVPVARQ